MHIREGGVQTTGWLKSHETIETPAPRARDVEDKLWDMSAMPRVTYIFSIGELLRFPKQALAQGQPVARGLANWASLTANAVEQLARKDSSKFFHDEMEAGTIHAERFKDPPDIDLIYRIWRVWGSPSTQPFLCVVRPGS